MNKIEHLLTCLTEECGEITQEACKAARFGLTDVKPGQPDDNKRRIEREAGQFLAVFELLGFKIHEEDKVEKREKLKKYMEYARQRGTLERES